MISVSLIFDLLLVGVILGSIYSLMAAGLTLAYGILRVINFAHGELYMLGGYALYFFVSTYRLPTIFGLPLSFAVGSVTASIIERALIRDTYRKSVERPVEYAVLATFALSIFLQNLAANTFGPYLFTPPNILLGTLSFYGVTITWNRIIASILTISVFLFLNLFLKYSWQGRTWRAVAQNRSAATAIGINVERVSLVSFAVGGGFAALAGGLLSPDYSVYPTVGVIPLVMSFVIIVIGGLGSVMGSLVAGVAIGIVQSLVSGLTSSLSLGYASVFVLMIIFLILRPQGLFGEKVRRA